MFPKEKNLFLTMSARRRSRPKTLLPDEGSLRPLASGSSRSPGACCSGSIERPPGDLCCCRSCVTGVDDDAGRAAVLGAVLVRLRLIFAIESSVTRDCVPCDPPRRESLLCNWPLDEGRLFVVALPGRWR